MRPALSSRFRAALALSCALGFLAACQRETATAPASPPELKAAPLVGTVVHPPHGAPPDPAAAAAASALAPFDNFSAWTAAYASAPDSARPALVAEGLAHARLRREALKAVIEHDPELALRLALDDATRASLPPAFAPYLERPVAAVGRYEVDIACGLPCADHDPASAAASHTHADEITRTLHVGDTRYRAFVYGRRLAVTTKTALPVHGIALDDALAVAESPIRRLPPTPGSGAFPYLLGDQRREAASLAELEDIEAAQAASELVLGPDPAEADSPWTEGAKTMLYIRVTFSDLPAAEPLSLATAQSNQATVATFYDSNSNGKVSLSTTFTPTLVLPQPESHYNANSWTVLLADARAAADAAGYPTGNYTFYTVATKKLSSMTWAGRAFIGGSGSHLNGDFALRVAAHEFGHNFGLYHANYNYTAGESPVSREAYAAAPANSPSQPYGHRYHMMGASGTTTAHHFSTREKFLLDWIPAADTPVVLQSSVRRLYRSDHRDATGLRGLRIPTGDRVRSHFWLSHRRLFPSLPAWSAGVEVLWGGSSNISDHSLLLDLTPFSDDGPHADSSNADNNDKVDAALTLGRMFGSPDSGAWFTILDQGGSSPAEWLDVGVEVGNFSRNRPPDPALSPSTATLAIGQSLSLTASATDPDGDTVVYSWDFGDGSFAGNQASVSKSWNTTGHYVVRVVAVDQKGGYSSARCVVRVGSPATFTASGRVLADGQPVEGVRVFNGLTGSAYRGTRSDSEGRFTLPNLATGTYTLHARKEGHVFAPAFANPVAISAHVTDLDFNATASPPPYVIVDNTDPTGVEITATTGSWVSLSSVAGFHASDYLTDNNTGKGQKQITFRPNFAAPGLYRVYIRYTESTNRATNVPVDIAHLGGLATFTVDQTTGGGLWNYLGAFSFDAGPSSFARIRTDNTNGHVAADSFKFELAGELDPTVRLRTVRAAATEQGLSPALLRIEREGPLGFPLTVHLATDVSADDAATPGIDFVPLPSSVTLPADVDHLELAVTPLADDLPEGDETLRVALRPPPDPEQEWLFDDPSGTTLAQAANTHPDGVSWTAALHDTATTGSGALRIRYTAGTGNVSASHAILPAPPATTRYLVLETSGWTFTGTSANEVVRLGFTTGANSTVTAQLVLSRTDAGVQLSGEALGTGAAAIPGALITPSTTTTEPWTFVLAVDPVGKTYRISHRQGATGAFTTLGSAAIAPDRALAALRINVLNSFASTTAEKFDIDRIALESADPTQPAYVIAPPSEAELVIRDDPRNDWRFRRFTAEQLANPAISGWSADPDGDGLSNFAEYAFGRSPFLPDAAALTTPLTVQIGETPHLAIRYLRRTEDTTLAYLPEATGDLGNPLWPDTALPFGPPAPTSDPDYEEVIYRDPQPLGTRRFLRVRVE